MRKGRRKSAKRRKSIIEVRIADLVMEQMQLKQQELLGQAEVMKREALKIKVKLEEQKKATDTKSREKQQGDIKMSSLMKEQELLKTQLQTTQQELQKSKGT